MSTKPLYIYLTACLACIAFLASCSSDNRDEIAGEQGAEMTFAVSDGSRASITTAIDRFAVYGDMKFMGQTETPTSPILIFVNTEVKKTDDGWQYQGARYWFPNREYSFVAIHPISVLNDAQYEDSKLSFNYSLPNSNDDVADIIAATHRRLFMEEDKGKNTNTTTVFRFSHLFSRINFLLELSGPSAGSEEYCKIHKLEMSGFGTSASISIKPASRQSNVQTDDHETVIATAKGNGSLQISFDDPIKVINGASAIPMFDGNNALILLPQTFADGDEVQIRLTYSENDEKETTEVSASLSDFKWLSGQSYIYKIKLELEEREANMVVSEATIVPWNLIDDHGEVDAK